MFNITKFIDFKFFLIALALGIALVYLWNPSPTVIFVYPNSENWQKLQVKDATGKCFKFIPKNVECPSDLSKITNTPIQTGHQENKFLG